MDEPTTDAELERENAALTARLDELQAELNDEKMTIQNYDVQMLNLRFACLVDLLCSTLGMSRLQLDVLCNRTQVTAVEQVLANHKYQKVMSQITVPFARAVPRLAVARR